MWKRGITLLKGSEKGLKKQKDQVSFEHHIAITINDMPPKMVCTSGQLEDELVLGFVASNTGNCDISTQDIEKTDDGYTVTLKKSHPISDTTLDQSMTVTPVQVIQLTAMLQEKALLYSSTGITHRSAIASPSHLSEIAEDINRLSSIDKAIGAALISKTELGKHLLMTSGKLTVDVIKKAHRCEIPIVISRSGPSSLAIDYANNAGITLIGFARGKTFNVYTHPNRIT